MTKYSLWPSKLYISGVQEQKILGRVNFFYIAFAYSLLIAFVGVIFIISLFLFVESATSGGSVNDSSASTLLVPIAFSTIAGYLVKGVPSLIASAPQVGEVRIGKLWEKPLLSSVFVVAFSFLSASGIYLAIGLAINLTSSRNNSPSDLFLSFIGGSQPLELPILTFLIIILAGGAGLFTTCLVLIYYIAYPWTKGLHASIRRWLFFPTLKIGSKNPESGFKNRCPQCCHDEFELVEFREEHYCSCNCCGLVKAQIDASADKPSSFYQVESEKEA